MDSHELHEEQVRVKIRRHRGPRGRRWAVVITGFSSHADAVDFMQLTLDNPLLTEVRKIK